MNEFSLLRSLAEFQQYAALQQTAQRCWHETQSPELLPLLALAAAFLGNMTEAKAYCEQAQAHKATLDNDALCDLAAVLITMQQAEQAKALLAEVLTVQPNNSLALARLAFCELSANNTPKAQALFEQSLARNNQPITVHNQLIDLYIKQRQYSPAQEQLAQAFSVIKTRQQEYPSGLHLQYWVLLNRTQLQLWAAAEHHAEAEAWLQDTCQLQQSGGCSEAIFIAFLTHYCGVLAGHDRHQQASDMLREYARQYPENSELCLAQAEMAQVQGHFMQAVALLQKAIKFDDENIALWVQLSNACLHRFDQRARKAAEQAVALATTAATANDQTLAIITLQQVQANNALAQVENQDQHFDVAETLWREILAQQENFIPALQGLGQQQMQRGKLDEALALFERIKAIDPLKGHSALINARHFPEDIETLGKMEHAANQPSLEGRLRSGILFQVAAAWEKRKNYRQAFACAQQANAASKQFLNYDAKAHRNQCARIRTCFSKPLYEHRADCGVDSRMPIYVVGMPRSGTTLVEQILSGHSEIFGAGELGVIPQVVAGMERWERHTGSGRKFPDCIDDYNAYVIEGIANNVLKELQALAEAGKPEAHYVVDKLPHNFENIGLIKFLFPNAKIISVRRDPRDIAISNYFTDYQAKHGGMGYAYNLETIGEQLADHNLLMHHWAKTFPDDILEINYEDVVDDLEGSARKMLNYIGLEWQPEVLKFNELERTVKTASVWQVRQPIYKTSKAKWLPYEWCIGPLIKGTNAKIAPEPITDMISLPQPSFMTDGVSFYNEGKLDEAEICFKKMLHHNPNHAACHYMVGLVYMSKNHPKDGIHHIETALKTCPWQQEWQQNLIKAYRQEGLDDKAQALEQRNVKTGNDEPLDDFLTEEMTAQP